MEAHLEEAHRSMRLAERDLRAYQVLKVSPGIDLSTIGFHAQQVIEKSIKAVLFLNNIEFTRTHDLVELSLILQNHNILLPITNERLNEFNPFAVLYRYDDHELSVTPNQEMDEIVWVIFHWAKDTIQTATRNLGLNDNV